MGNLNFGLNDVDQMVRAFDTRGRRRLDLTEFSKLHAFLTSIQNRCVRWCEWGVWGSG